MGYYIHLSCCQMGCGFSATIGNATEFYIDDEGKERCYGHPVPTDSEAAQHGIAGYWQDLLCWNCGREDHNSVRLPVACHSDVLAWALFPPPDPKTHLQSCPDCNDVLCDQETIQMFLEYRADPARRRAELTERLQAIRQQPKHDMGRSTLDDWMRAFIHEMYGTPDETRLQLETELADLQQVHTEEEMILYRLGLTPVPPVREDSLLPLLSRYRSVYKSFTKQWNEVDGHMEAIKQSHQQHDDGARRGSAAPDSYVDDLLRWLRSPRMRAWRRLNMLIGELMQLRTHLWIAKRLLRDEAGTLVMFRARCPKCRSEPLAMEGYQT